MLRKTSLNTALLVAILFLLLTKEPPRIEASPIQIAPAKAEPLAAATAETPPAPTAEKPVTPAPAVRDYSAHVNDPVAYYKAKERHLRTALMKKR